VYQSNRKIGDEYRYVFNRKNAKRFVGNTLERPQLIMKRLKVRDTTFDNEVIKEGAAYDKVMADKSYKTMANMRGAGAHAYMARRCMPMPLAQIYSFQNFLKHATLVHKNLHPDKDGLVKCNIDLDHCSSVLILATNEKATTQIIVDNLHANEEIEKRNLTVDPLD